MAATFYLRNMMLKSKVVPTSFLGTRHLTHVNTTLRSFSDKKEDPVSSLTTYKKTSAITESAKDRRTFEAHTPSPYRRPGPRRYGHVLEYMTDGPLPRDGKPVRSLPEYRPTDRWEDKRALFGQNDYIDILGDGDVHPADLLTGPVWLRGFRGNERERLMRQLEFEGPKLKLMYPTEFNRIEKRIRYLTKITNFKRRNRWSD